MSKGQLINGYRFKPYKRWHSARNAISASRIPPSVAKNSGLKLNSNYTRSLSYTAFHIDFEETGQYGTDQVGLSELNPKYARSLSYCALDVEPEETGHFGIDQACLSQLVENEDVQKLTSFGGVEAVAQAVKSSAEGGISDDSKDLLLRQHAFGSNCYGKPPAKTLFHFVLKALEDPMIIFLLLCALFSLIFGIVEHGLEGWTNGGSVIFAVLLVVAASSISNYWPSRQFNRLSKINDSIKVEVVRNQSKQQIPVVKIVVGDVVCLKPQSKVPADGLLLGDYPLQVHKLILTGDNNHVEVNCRHPFLYSGYVVTSGCAKMLVTSVGFNTAWAKKVNANGQDSEQSTLLQARLQRIASLMSKAGLSIGFLILIVLLFQYFIREMKNRSDFCKTIHDIANDLIGISATAVVTASGAMGEGLPMAVAVTFACSMKRMTKSHALVRNLAACEALASTTTICTRLCQTTVTKFFVGSEFVEIGMPPPVAPTIIRRLHQGIGLNTTQPPSKASSFFWNPTEKAIISWAIKETGMNMKELKESCCILQGQPFDSVKTCCRFFIRNNGDDTIHVYWKGTSEAILNMCSQYYDTKGAVKTIDGNSRSEINQIAKNMAEEGLRCVAFAHRQIFRFSREYEFHDQVLDENDMILVALVGVNDPCQPDRKAVEDLQKAGVSIKMVTRESVLIAEDLARDCGILRTHQQMDNEVVNGEEFRNYTYRERFERVDSIRVIAEASPQDMFLLVQCQKQKGHVVAATSSDTADAAALMEADAGVSFGSQATDTVLESSDVVLMKENFGCVFTILKWGRVMFNLIQLSTQFQITVCITSLLMDFLTAVSAHETPNFQMVASISSGDIPFAALQLLWVKLIVGTLAALALAIEQPSGSGELMKPLVSKNTLITNTMWKNILAQAMYHITILQIIHFKGKEMFDVSGKVKDTLIFNTFVLCQVFNKFNARMLGDKNMFKKIHRNKLFASSIGFIIVIQAVMIEFLKRFGGTERLTWKLWGISIGLAAASWPIAWFVQWIPVPKTIYQLSQVRRGMRTKTLYRHI